MTDKIITPNSQRQQLDIKDQIMLNLMNQFNILTMEFDTLFEMCCDTEEKKQEFKKIMETKIKEYNEKVKSSQIKRQIMQK